MFIIWKQDYTHLMNKRLKKVCREEKATWPKIMSNNTVTYCNLNLCQRWKSLICVSLRCSKHKNLRQLSAWFGNGGNARFQFYIIKMVLLQQIRSAKQTSVPEREQQTTKHEQPRVVDKPSFYSLLSQNFTHILLVVFHCPAAQEHRLSADIGLPPFSSIKI